MFLILSMEFVSAELNLKITGKIKGYNADVWLKTNDNSVNEEDIYDFEAKETPSNYSQFYSNISGFLASIDSWNSLDNPRTLNLVYSLPSAQTGEINFSWESLAGSDFEGNLIYYGNDSSYSNSIASVNLRTEEIYSNSITNKDKVYLQVEISDYTESEDEGDDTESSTEGGSGGGSGGGASLTRELVINPETIDIDLAVNRTVLKKINLVNNGNAVKDVKINIVGLEEFILITENSFVLKANESKNISARFIASSNPGIYTGKIIINNQVILVSVSVSNEKVLFDSKINIADRYKTIFKGEKVVADVNLIPMGIDPRLDVTVNYYIKDYNGNTLLSESETILIEQEKTFSKVFQTQNLEEGDYLVGLELLYPSTNPEDVATSAAHFEIIKEPELSIYYFVIIGILILGILIMTILILLKKRK